MSVIKYSARNAGCAVSCFSQQARSLYYRPITHAVNKATYRSSRTPAVIFAGPFWCEPITFSEMKETIQKFWVARVSRELPSNEQLTQIWESREEKTFIISPSEGLQAAETRWIEV